MMLKVVSPTLPAGCLIDVNMCLLSAECSKSKKLKFKNRSSGSISYMTQQEEKYEMSPLTSPSTKPRGNEEAESAEKYTKVVY